MENPGAFILDQYEELTNLATDGHAVKLVRQKISGQLYVKKSLKRYDAETYRALSKAALPGIPKTHYQCEDEGRLIVIEDYIHGRTMEDDLQLGPIPGVRVREIALSLCQILEGLHSLTPPIIHRDLKPSNVMITESGTVKLIDFNAARQVKPAQVEDTHKLGTPGYAAPEQFGFSQSDARSDVYAMGILLNVLLTGKHPQEALVPRPFGAIITRCTQLAPEQRYQSVPALKMVVKALPLRRPKVSGAGRTHQAPENPSSIRESWALPGFRSHILWKSILAVLGYLFIGYCVLTPGGKDYGTPFLNFSNQLYMGLALLSVVFFTCNYRGLRDCFPFIKSDNMVLRVIFGLLWCFLLICIFAVINICIQQIAGH
ncbi:MAG: serine/threonine protein kinase [Eubacterium aggregans]